MEFVQKALAFIVCLGVLVAVHEYGHFWVARRNGIRVVRFSIGFGHPLWRWTDKQGTEFVIAAIPLGGYVKMVGEGNSDVPEEDRAHSFAHKSVGRRFAVVAAGPAVNLVFAFLLYWILFIGGMTGIAPFVGGVTEGSVVAASGIREGDEVVSVDGEVTNTWEAVNLALIDHIGDTGSITLGIKTGDDSDVRDVSLPIDRFMAGREKDMPLEVLGIERLMPKVPVVVGTLSEGKAGERQGMKVGDRILEVNGQPVESWKQWVELVRASPRQPLVLLVERDGDSLSLTVTPDESRSDQGKTIGLLGVMPLQVDIPPELIRTYSYSPPEAFVKALNHTRSLIVLTVETLWKMACGQISLDSLSGPITIAKLAGESASYGLEPYLSFVAYLSISLGVLNLLPIPVLDGGHLLFYALEWLKGSPVSEKVQVVGNSIGMALLFLLMSLAIYNDFASF